MRPMSTGRWTGTTGKEGATCPRVRPPRWRAVLARRLLALVCDRGRQSSWLTGGDDRLERLAPLVVLASFSVASGVHSRGTDRDRRWLTISGSFLGDHARLAVLLGRRARRR